MTDQHLERLHAAFEIAFKECEAAETKEYIRDPVAYALYTAWKIADVERERSEGK